MNEDKQFSDEYLARFADPSWDALKEKLIAQRNLRVIFFRCEDCQQLFDGVDGHHLTYERFWNERDEDIKLLCRPCHDKREEAKREAHDEFEVKGLWRQRVVGWARSPKNYGPDWREKISFDYASEQLALWLISQGKGDEVPKWVIATIPAEKLAKARGGEPPRPGGISTKPN